MIEKQHDEETMVCDGCGDPLDRSFDPGEFMAMIDYAKGQGWKVRKTDHTYAHWCPDCTPPGGGLAAQKALFGIK